MLNNKVLQKILNKYSCAVENSFELRNPATDGLICSLENKSAKYVQKAIAKSKQAQVVFKNQSARSKADLLLNWYDLIMQNSDDIAEIITIESGKPLAESKGELQYGANFIRWYAEKANRIDGRIFDPNLENMEGRVDYQPVGVVAAITPWNFPFAMITRKVAPAIAAGCSVVLKPSELTPLSAFFCRELFIEAGGDEDLFQIVCGDSKIIGKELLENKAVRKITFTGSTRVGKLLMQQAAESVKKGAKLIYGGKVDEELGGKFFKPTILDNITDEMLVSCDETFGPLIAIFEFKNEEEVIERANNTNYGLASYFFSEDMAQIRRVRNQLEYGMIGINTGVISSEKAPFGGIKESGLGREGSDDGIYEFMEAKYSLQSF
ncbi:UNVERIFIED_CONTAM: hypothetical protein GTU68_030100 [Idotea baltica]|nr:hypothetical protein [Idotea baltica]